MQMGGTVGGDSFSQMGGVGTVLDGGAVKDRRALED